MSRTLERGPRPGTRAHALWLQTLFTYGYRAADAGGPRILTINELATLVGCTVGHEERDAYLEGYDTWLADGRRSV